ncbi:MAG: hypothetical protein KC983_08140 [Phycisphaerales bacterium]|nr:hypothetical protein [Phycisphaerales bacterium]
MPRTTIAVTFVTLTGIALAASSSALTVGKASRSGDASARPAATVERGVEAGEAGLSGGGGGIGPDVIVGQVGLDPGNAFGSFANYPSANGYRAYAVNTTSCNIGDEDLSWRDGTPEAPDNRHPVIAQNMYRYKDGRFEQIGLAWLKHGFCALSDDLCGTCTAALDCDFLVPGCSDPYSAGTNGNDPGRLGPRYEVNPRTGDFPFPPDDSAALVDSTYRRLRVNADDVSAALNPGATWIIEAQYVAADDAAAENDNNNASHREILLDANGAITNFASGTVQSQPAIMAWPVLDADAAVSIVDVTGAGRFYVGHAAHDLGDGTWAYEYAVYNMNADLPAYEVSVGRDASACIGAIGFGDVEYLPGEPSDGADWTPVDSMDAITWSTATLFDDANANVLRWGTMYTYRFVSNGAPVSTMLTVALSDDTMPSPNTDSFAVAVMGPGSVCTADCTPPGGNGTVNIDDLVAVLNAFGATESACDVAPTNADCSSGNGSVNIDDIVFIINHFGPCP